MAIGFIAGAAVLALLLVFANLEDQPYEFEEDGDE
jgi:hypothetical protein